MGLPTTDEIQVLDGDPDADGRWVALYRKGDRLAGALTLNGQNVIMKYRGLLMRKASWVEALDFAESRRRSSLSSS